MSAHASLWAWAQAALPSAALLEEMTARSSFHEATNDFAPSSCSFAARVSMSTPAFPKAASTSSQFAPVGAQQRTELAMIGERLQRVLGHRVDRERGGEPLHI